MTRKVDTKGEGKARGGLRFRLSCVRSSTTCEANPETTDERFMHTNAERSQQAGYGIKRAAGWLTARI